MVLELPAAGDQDGDGYAPPDDCDDHDDQVYPGAEELCDGLDNDCNGVIDDNSEDSDGDGFSDCVDPSPFGFDGAEDRQDPLSAQLHLHGPLSEYDATMAWHTREAERIGVDLLWWSEHSTMVSMATRVDGYDFENGALTDVVDLLFREVEHGFFSQYMDLTHLDSELIPGGEGDSEWYWHLEGAGDPDTDWREASFVYSVQETAAEHMPLLADVTVRLKVRPTEPLDDSRQLAVTVGMSGNLDGGINQITYFAGGDDLSHQTTTSHLYLPLETPSYDVWSVVELPLTEDAEHFVERDDQTAMTYVLTVRSRDGATVGLDIDDLEFEWQIEGEQLFDYQQQVLDERYSDGGVTHFVGQEISLIEDGGHVNPIGPDRVPIPDHEALGFIPRNQAVDHAHEHDSWAMCAHPYGSSYFEVTIDGAYADQRQEELVAEWLEADVFGCDMVEVGYPARIVDLAHHLGFWDDLAVEGWVMTGTGVSDNHWCLDWVEFSNPFITWVFQDVPTRAGVSEKLYQGRAFFGHPGYFVGEHALLDVWSEHGAVMGQVMETDLDQVIHVETSYVEMGWTLALIVDGDVRETVDLAGDETDTAFEVERADVRLIRAELIDDRGTTILVSNPLYLVQPGEADGYPPHRLAW